MPASVDSSDTLLASPISIKPPQPLEYIKEPSPYRIKIRQQPVSITLDGTAIVISTVGLITLVHFSEPYLVQLLISTIPLILLIHNDYQNFLNLGPGGVPSTVPGYIKISFLRLLALRDPFVAPDPDPTCLPGHGILSKCPLPYRAGPLPIVAGIAPQRQVDQHGSETCYHALRRSMVALGQRSPTKFGTARSCLEKHGLALFARHPLRTSCQGEVFHVHDSDHSMHMCLHPDDIKEVLAKGWGRRHPLAWRNRFVKMSVPQEFVMIYAPRDDHELQNIYNIIEAAIWYNTADYEKVGEW